MSPKPKKILILLPDGVGLRNFAFTSFVEQGEKLGWEIKFWNLTPFDLSEMGYSEIKLQPKPRALTDLLKRAKIEAELNHFQEKFNDPVYETYKFPSSSRKLKSRFKTVLVSKLVSTYNGEKGLEILRKRLKDSERKSAFYRQCIKTLQQEKPDLVFCTNQRPVNAIAPLTAAQDLGIPTGTFIFSWDNLPKATMVIQPDFYCVWSEYMKQELLKYYPFINAEKVFITGSPQFEPHFNTSLLLDRDEFFKEHNLEHNKKYLLFSGDDKTTCPDDPQYLRDIAEAVEKLNINGHNLGILFRRCPVDFSDRYDSVLKKYKGLIVPICPKWEKAGENWNTILPTKADLKLQANTLFHAEMVINLGSSMVFDAALFNKPCLYLNYEVEDKSDSGWHPQKVYDFVHFRSMPSEEAVTWLKLKEEIPAKLENAVSNPDKQIEQAKLWFEKINLSPAYKASERIWTVLEKITE